MDRHSPIPVIILIISLIVPALGHINTPSASVRDFPEEERGGSRGIIVVNGTGSGDYTHIQWAIDNASSGDTVYVEPGTYRETITVDKKIGLIGADRNTTIIVGDPNNDTVTITANHVRVKNFEVRTSSSGDGIKVENANNCTIKNNNCSNNGCGIYLRETRDVNVIGNICNSNFDAGIYLRVTINANVIRNVCNNNDLGLGGFGIHAVSSSNNNILQNNCSYNGFEGIDLLGSDNNFLNNNNCSNNRHGMEIDGSNNVVSNNIVFHNGIGIYIFSEPLGSIIINNHIRANVEGIYISGSSNVMSNNNVLDNLLSGIVIRGFNHHIMNNSVCNNNIEQWYYPGAISMENPEYVTITGNTISFNKDCGISGGGTRCIISNNVINNNSMGGILMNYFHYSAIYENNIMFSGERAIMLCSDSSHNNIQNNVVEQGGIYLNSLNADNLLTLDIDSTNTINGKPLYFMKNSTYETVPKNGGQVILVNCKNVIVENQNISNCYVGIQVVISTDCTVLNNTLINNSHAGIEIYGTDYIPDPEYPCKRNLIMNNTCLSNMNGIYLFRADENDIVKNTLKENLFLGINISYDCEDNDVFENIFIDNRPGRKQAADYTGDNIWYRNERGNFWSDWSGLDVDVDGIIDEPYHLYGNVDPYPLLNPTGTPIPIAHAGLNITVDQHQTVNFNSSASMGSPFIINYSWCFIYDDSPISLFGSSPNFTFHTAGNYNVTLEVENWLHETTNSTLGVTVRDITPPIIDGMDDISIDENETVLFDASLCRDNVGIADYTWEFIYDHELITRYEMNFSFRFQTVGIYPITLTLLDKARNSASHTFTVTVKDITPPSAEAGEDISISYPVMVTFNGEKSTDNIGIVNYTWEFNHGGRKIRLYGRETGFHFQETGRYPVHLTVYDLAGNRDTDVLYVTFLDTLPPVADAGGNITVDQNDVVLFNGSSSGDNVEITDFSWEFVYANTTMIVKEWNWNFTFSIPGNYTVSLRVFDGEGFQDEDRIWVNVKDIIKPTANAGDDILIEPGETMRLADNGSWDNVGILNYTWSFEYNSSKMILQGKYVNFEVTRAAKFVVKLTVYDADGNYGEDWLIVTVKADENGNDDTNNSDKEIGSSIGKWIALIALILILAGIFLFVFMRNRKANIKPSSENEGGKDGEKQENGDGISPAQDSPVSSNDD